MTIKCGKEFGGEESLTQKICGLDFGGLCILWRRYSYFPLSIHLERFIYSYIQTPLNKVCKIFHDELIHI